MPNQTGDPPLGPIHVRIGNFGAAAFLTGAGFSRNWGGYLSPEFFDRLIGHRVVAGEPRLRQLLLECVEFEAALARVRTEEYSQEEAKLLEGAIIDVFKQHDGAVRRAPPTGPTSVDVYGVQRFLTRFYGPDTGYIFTLNQDLTLERYYYNYDVWGRHVPRPTLPGIPNHPDWFTTAFGKLARDGLPDDYTRTIPDAFPSLPPDTVGALNYVKLHGSFDWKSDSGGGLLIAGADKATTLSRSPLLSWYLSLFRAVCNGGTVRLLVSGYSFRDAHINAILASAIADSQLRLFIHDAITPSHMKERLCSVAHGREIWSGVIGYSAHPFTSIFPPTQESTDEHDRMVSALFGGNP